MDVSGIGKRMAASTHISEEDALAYVNQHFSSISLLIEAAHLNSLTEVATATACVLYHRTIEAFKKEKLHDRIDMALVVSTSLYLASKVAEEPRKIRDVINVVHRMLHTDEPPLQIGNSYWKLRDSVVAFELYLLRLLNFDVKYPAPHKFLLCSINMVVDHFGKDEPRCHSLKCVAWILLQNLFYLPFIGQLSSQLITTCVLYTAMQIVGVNLTLEKEWWKILGVDCQEIEIQEVSQIALRLYEWNTQKTMAKDL